MHRLCTNICNSPLPLRSQSTAESSSPMTATQDATPSTDDLHDWRLAQAAGFCLAAQFLAQRTIFSQEKPARLLDTVQWFCMADYLRHDSELGERPGRKMSHSMLWRTGWSGFSIENYAGRLQMGPPLVEPPTAFHRRQLHRPFLFIASAFLSHHLAVVKLNPLVCVIYLQ